MTNPLRRLFPPRAEPSAPTPDPQQASPPTPASEELSFVSRVNEAINRSNAADLEALAEHIVTIMEDALQCIGGALLLVDKDEHELVPFVYSKIGPFLEGAIPLLSKPFREHRFDLDETQNLTVRTARTGKTLVSADYRNFLVPVVPPSVAWAIQRVTGMRTIATVPVTAEKHVLGVLMIGFRERELSPVRMQLLELFAGQCAVAINNAQRYEEIRLLLEREREASLKLRSIDKMRSDLLLMAGHELRTPLAAVRYGMELFAMNEGVGKALAENDRDLLQRLLEQLNQLDDMVEHICKTLRALHGRLEVSGRPLRVDELLRDILGRRTSEFFDSRVEVEFRNEDERTGALILGDAAHLRYAFWELITNAIKHGGSGAKIVITLRISEGTEKPRLRIDVENTGKGIPGELKERLFREHFAVESSLENKSVPGMGLGLYLVNKIVDLHRGSIEVQSDSASHTRFTIFLPVVDAPFSDQAVGT